jgi:hypothetical protein
MLGSYKPVYCGGNTEFTNNAVKMVWDEDITLLRSIKIGYRTQEKITTFISRVNRMALKLKFKNSFRIQFSKLKNRIDSVEIFESNSIVVDKMALGQVFLRVLRFSPVSFIPPSLSNSYHLGDEQYVR